MNSDPLSLGPRDLFAAVSHGANASDLGVAVVETIGAPRVLYANEGLQQLSGYTLEELSSVDLWRFMASDSLVRLQQIYAAIQRGEATPRTIETAIVHKSGERIPVEVRSTAISINGDRAEFAFVLDLRDRKRAEQELRESEARFRRLVESAPDGVMILRGLQVVFANPAAGRVFGVVEAEELDGCSLGTFLVPESADRAARLLQGLMAGALPEESLEFETLRGRFLEASWINVEYEGQPAVLTFARDTTERRAIQARLLQADRLAAVGMLAAGVAHEINNPLSYVLLNLRYLQRQLGKLALVSSEVAKLTQHVEDATHGAERVQTIVRDLRIFARADGDATGPVDLVLVLESALGIADHEIRHRAELRREYTGTVVVSGTRAKLEQVFLNLLMNAAQALETTDSRQNVITVSVSRQGQRAIAVVSDNGPGIPTHQTEKVFEPFFSTKPPGLGTGLGLSICKSIIETFGGRITVSSVPGRTDFRVELAALDEVAPISVASVPASLESPSTARGRLLIVDDETSVASMLARTFETQYAVTTCAAAEEALQVLLHTEFDVVLCDVMMPGMNGMALYDELGHSSPAAQDRFIFMTGGGLLPEVSEFLSRIERPKIEKPFDLAKLTELLEQVALSCACKSSPMR